ncbi:hypothetical protein STUTZSP0542_25470 [Stutzerimonas marianensis]
MIIVCSHRVNKAGRDPIFPGHARTEEALDARGGRGLCRTPRPEMFGAVDAICQTPTSGSVTPST